MKVLVIPDIHLKPHIFDRAMAVMELGIAENAVCLMDLPDDWGKGYHLDEYKNTFDRAIEFAKAFPNSKWCYGNHDLCYLWDERETGFSKIAQYTVVNKLRELNECLPQDNQIKYVQTIDNCIFCHGGLSSYFVEKYVEEEKQDNLEQVLKVINSLGSNEMWCDDSPIWCRPQDDDIRMYGEGKYMQVVGHTPVGKSYQKGNVISCDVFSTYSDGSPIGTQKLLLIDTKNFEFREV